MIGDPWRLRLTRKTAVLARIFPHFDFSIEENVHGENSSTMTPSLIVMTELLKLFIIHYYESTKRKLKTKNICGCRCYERLHPNTKEFTCLSYTELVLELEHLKIETRLITEMFANVIGECENEMR